MAPGAPTHHVGRWGRRRHEIGRLILRRLAVMVPMFFAITAAVFALASVSPFDPLDSYLNGQAGNLTPEQREQLTRQLGLDMPWWRSWFVWLQQLVHGDLGVSRVYGQSVTDVVLSRLPWTMLLGALGLVLAVLMSFFLGAWAGLRPNGAVDRMVSALATVIQATPPFVFALAGLSVFALTLHWVPTGGLTYPGQPVTFWSTVHHIIVPALVLAVTQIPWLVLSLRESVIDATRSEAVTGARVRGIPPRLIVRGHILPVSVPPFVALIGARLSELIVGSTLVESIFGWPGLGTALVKSAQSLDFPLLTFLTIATTAVVLLGNLLADITFVLLDPRVDADA